MKDFGFWMSICIIVFLGVFQDEIKLYILAQTQLVKCEARK